MIVTCPRCSKELYITRYYPNMTTTVIFYRWVCINILCKWESKEASE